MPNKPKIGDRVRFLSETGGGRVTGFRGKNIVLVEDEDGFEAVNGTDSEAFKTTISKGHTSK